MGAIYLVTDLEIRARFDLGVLDGELQRAGLFGHVARQGSVWRGIYESGRHFKGQPSPQVNDLLSAVEGLSPEAKELWDRCVSRRFDLGYEGDDRRPASRWRIGSDILRRIAAVNADFVVTIYPPGNMVRDEGASPET